jgi:hypothetical protein
MQPRLAEEWDDIASFYPDARLRAQNTPERPNRANADAMWSFFRA